MSKIFLSPLFSFNEGAREWSNVWQPSGSTIFQVRSYYQVLSNTAGVMFPWKCIWKSKVPPRVNFFIWTAALGKILTADNLRRRHVILVSWCCMCKGDGETIDHLFLHCKVAKEMWDTVFNLFGLTWVMPKRVVDLLSCWQGKMGRHRNIEIWRAIPHCLMWCLWKERNARLFEANDRNVLELKMVFFRTLFGWRTATGLSPSLSYLEFFDLCF